MTRNADGFEGEGVGEKRGDNGRRSPRRRTPRRGHVALARRVVADLAYLFTLSRIARAIGLVSDYAIWFLGSGKRHGDRESSVFRKSGIPSRLTSRTGNLSRLSVS